MRDDNSGAEVSTPEFFAIFSSEKNKQRKVGVIYMPIRIPEELPAAKTLQEENIFVMDIM